MKDNKHGQNSLFFNFNSSPCLRVSVARIGLLVCAALVVCSGCFRRQTGTPPPTQQQQPPLAGDTQKAPKEEEQRPGGLPNIFQGSRGPQYNWDGQMSSSQVKAPLDVAYAHSMDSLKSLGFGVKSEDTWRRGWAAQISGVRADKTTALVLLNEKTPGFTEVRTRITQVGDRTGSERLLGEIEKAAPTQEKASAPQAKAKLPPLPPSPPPLPPEPPAKFEPPEKPVVPPD